MILHTNKTIRTNLGLLPVLDLVDNSKLKICILNGQADRVIAAKKLFQLISRGQREFERLGSGGDSDCACSPLTVSHTAGNFR